MVGHNNLVEDLFLVELWRYIYYLQIDRWMFEWMDWQMDGQTNRFINVWMGGLTNGWTDKQIHKCLNGWIDKWMKEEKMFYPLWFIVSLLQVLVVEWGEYKMAIKHTPFFIKIHPVHLEWDEHKIVVRPFHLYTTIDPIMNWSGCIIFWL